MGVEYALACKKCKHWIDLHKCRHTYDTCTRGWAPYYEEPDEQAPDIETYWAGRALWFIWKHREHGQALKWYFDADDSYWVEMREFDQVDPHNRK